MNYFVTPPAIVFSTAALTLALGTPVQAQSQPQSAKCDISDRWEYRSPRSIALQNGQYIPVNRPYTTEVELTETNPRQESIREGNRTQVVRIATLRASNPDPAAQGSNARMVTSMRVGETAGILLAVPVEGVPYGGGLVLEGKVSANCQTIQGQASVGGVGEKFPFILQRQSSRATNAPPNSATSTLSGNWVLFLGRQGKFDNFGVDRLTQTGNQLQLVSGISGQTFSGRISGQRVELQLSNGLNVGTLNQSGSVITFPDMVMVRLGSPTCPTANTCKVP
ncbi:MAG: hypothetical protein NZ772_05780 [Cyanobacteria bacterium]|nr:hypothetical protein [Cyanobacteriota bacterium]MDW8201021.1 hypothetical protein [Cyanobacteriota bacterium SKYGB_h_bin112]